MTQHDRLLQFLRDLPALPDSVAIEVWGNAFKLLIAAACPDIDHVSLVVNYTPGPNDIDGTVVIHRHIFPDGAESLRAHSRGGGQAQPEFRWQQFIDEPRPGFVSYMESCHPPIGFDYRSNGVYYGTIILWRMRHKDPSALEESRELMAMLSSVITMTLENFVLRAWAASPWLLRYRSIVQIVAKDVELREREREVLALLALGQRSEEIGNSLCISPLTARKHINNLLLKCGVNSIAKLLAKYTAPPG